MRGGGSHFMCCVHSPILSCVFKEEMGYMRVAQRMSPLEDFYSCKLHGWTVPRLNLRK